MNMVLRTMDYMHVDVGILTETKLTHEMYTKDCCDYLVLATKAASSHQGGVALFYRKQSDRFAVEGIRTHGPNVISCTLVMGYRHWSLVGVYIAPSDTDDETLKYVEEAVRTRVTHPLILLGDLNVDSWKAVMDDCSENIAAAMALHGLIDLADSFTNNRGRWTWSQWRLGRYVRSVTDCVLTGCTHDFS